MKVLVHQLCLENGDSGDDATQAHFSFDYRVEGRFEGG